MKKAGITTTIPLEILIASGYQLVDLNNAFIGSSQYADFISKAERAGFPRNICTWIKGIYIAALEEQLDSVVGVTGGDCSNTRSMVEVLENKGIDIIPFAFPERREYNLMKETLDRLMNKLGVLPEKVEEVRNDLSGLRKLAAKIDELTWKDNKVTGWENHISLVSFSDLKSNPLMFERELKDFIATAGNRKQMTHTLRIAYVGVPPVLSDIYDFVELCDARVVYNEVQKEFAFIDADEHATVYDQYLNYSYPFDMPFRITKINYELKKRKVDGIIHYTQAFCHRAIDHIMLRDAFKVPVINIEGDKENILDARSKLRLEAFLDMLKDKKQFGE